MEFNTVFDISSIIWNKEDYEANKHQYYGLTSSISTFLIKLEEEKPIILLRNELLEEMTNGFPFDTLPNEFHDFGGIVYSFLGNIGSQIITYPDNVIPNLDSIPSLIKNHFNDATQNEVRYLLSKIHTHSERQNVYFTFDYLWDGEGRLKTQAQLELKEYETIISDRGSQLNDFFAKFRLIFEHKPKHDCSINKDRDAWNDSDDKGNFESQLSCYCDGDSNVVQEILDKRHKKCFGNNSYYGYDKVNNVYVVFRITLNNIYHAYDMYDIERVPQEVKNEFRIWKY